MTFSMVEKLPSQLTGTLAALVIVCCAGVSAGCSSSTGDAAEPAVAKTVEAPVVEEEAKADVQPVSFSFVGTGDVLSHEPVIARSIQPDGSYDIYPLLSSIEPYIKGADVALCHQEIPYTYDEAASTGWPVFAAPAGWAQSLAKLGYDGCSLASNHTWDQGYQGIVDTIDILNAAGLGTAGANKSADQQPIQYYTVTKDGREVTVAHLSFTYELNQGVVPQIEADPWLVNVENPDHIIDLATKARRDGADVVIVSVHSGIEYQVEPSDEQRRWSTALAQSGVVDVYMGHHTHVAQPIEKIAGGPDGQGMWAFFGAGNLLSAMDTSRSDGTQTGFIARATVTVPAEGPAVVDDVGWTGLILDTRTSQVFIADSYSQADHPGSLLGDDAAAYYYSVLKSAMGQTPQIVDPPQGGADVAVVTR